ncbi:MAG: DNA polymerase-3 subunit epsilon [Pseudohongiellaceae bacterium]|jgi:DNA polymerase-3 subunit epsilon
MNAPTPSARSLELTRPLVVFDLETTGVDTNSDRIVEIGLVRLLPGGARESRSWMINPGRPIPAGASAVHGISDGDVSSAPSFAEVAEDVLSCFEGCDVSGFNVARFDLPLLAKEFGRVNVAFPPAGTVVVDSYTLFMRREPRNLTAAVSLYCDRDHAGAHRAVADAEAAADVLLGQLSRYADLPPDVAGLAEACQRKDPSWLDGGGKVAWQGDDAVLTFGKHARRPLSHLVEEESAYLSWVLGADFPADTKLIISEALEGRFPAREGRSSPG